MNFAIFWKTLGDLCLYFSVVSAFPTLFSHSFSYLWILLLCAGGVGLSAALSDRFGFGWRLVGLVVPAAGFAFCSGTVELLTVLPPVVYAWAVIISGYFRLEYLSYRAYFRKSFGAALAFLLLIFVAFTVEEMTRPWMNVFSYQGPAVFTVIAGAGGVALLRLLRLGTEGNRKMNGTQTALLLGGTGAVVASIVGIYQLLVRYGEELMNSLSEIIRGLLAAPMGLVAWIIGLLLENIEEMYEETQQSTMPTVEPTETPKLPGFAGDPVATEPAQPETWGFPWWLLVVILAVMAVVLYFAMKQNRGRRTKVDHGVRTEKADTAERKTRENRSGNRAKVRKTYREYLKYEKRRGTVLRTDQTSLDIYNARAEETNGAAAESLRQIYLKARYSDSTEITAKDAAKAKSELKKIKGQ